MFDGKNFREIEGRQIDAFSVFKKGIKPAWEDPANQNGSELSTKKIVISAETIDTWWENMVLGVIGETIEEDNEICGCRVADKSQVKAANPRIMYKMELWLRRVNTDEGDGLKRRLCDAILEGDSTKSKTRQFPEFDLTHRKQ